jgi:hypothetical protein
LWWRQINVLFNETRSHAGNFPCYFIANSADDFQTTTLEVDNIGAILAVNIIIMLGGDYQSADQPRAGQEKLKSTITPAKIDSSNVLSVNQTAKKSKNRSKRATRRLEAEFQNLQLDPSSANVSKNSTTKSSVSNVESCAPSTSSSKIKSKGSSDDDKNSAAKKNKPLAQKEATNTTITPSNTNNNNTKTKEDNNKEASDTKNNRKAMLAQHTRVNTVLNNKYKITEKITDVVHGAVFDGRHFVAKVSYFVFSLYRNL